MKVILLKDARNLGKKGDIVTVSDGYGANFIIPQKVGVLLTEQALVDYDKNKAKEVALQEAKKAEAQELSGVLSSVVLEFTAKVGKDGRMIGNVSPKQICEKLKSEFKIDVDKRKFLDHFQVSALGYTNFRVELFKDVVGTIRVHVSEGK